MEVGNLRRIGNAYVIVGQYTLYEALTLGRGKFPRAGVYNGN